MDYMLGVTIGVTHICQHSTAKTKILQQQQQQLHNPTKPRNSMNNINYKW